MYIAPRFVLLLVSELIFEYFLPFLSSFVESENYCAPQINYQCVAKYSVAVVSSNGKTLQRMIFNALAIIIYVNSLSTLLLQKPRCVSRLEPNTLVCLQAMEQMAMKNQGRITCPRTGAVCNFQDLSKAYISWCFGLPRGCERTGLSILNHWVQNVINGVQYFHCRGGTAFGIWFWYAIGSMFIG